MGMKAKDLGDHNQSDQQFPGRPPKKLLVGQALKSFVPHSVQELDPTSRITSQ
jgi:hypothetical protein